MKQVARLAGVGVKTVSRVLNDEPNVTPATSKRVWDAVQTLDYHLDRQAGSLRRAGRRTLSIGLLISAVDNPFAGGIHRAVEAVSREHGVVVLASSLNDDPEQEVSAIREFLRRRVDGLVLTTASQDLSYLASSLLRGLPAVFVDRVPPAVSADVVTSDNHAAGVVAARHLIERGHSRIAMLGDRQSIQSAAARRQGFLEEVGRAGLAVSDIQVIGEIHDAAGSRRAMEQLLASSEPPTAVFSAQNLITIGAVQALRAAGQQHSVALIGVDDIPLADLLEPGLTVIAQDPQLIGRIAAERLHRRIAGEQLAPEHILVPTKLIMRGSGEIRPPA